MMVIDPHRFFDELIDAGADSITIHYESTPGFDSTLSKLTSLNIESSVINPNTSLTTVQSYLAELTNF